MKKYIFNHTETNPLIVNDYPYGFKLRTQIKYWIETTPKKGDRFCSQTLNPKNNKWNAPKKGTYSCLAFMYLDDKNYIQYSHVTIYSNRQKVEEFINEIGGIEKLNTEQKKIYNSLMGINEVKTNEFTGKEKKDFAVKWEKGWKDETKMAEVRITFDRPDGVSLKEIFKAMKSLNQHKLNEVYDNEHGIVRVCVRGGAQLGSVSQDTYKEWLSSDQNTIETEQEQNNRY